MSRRIASLGLGACSAEQGGAGHTLPSHGNILNLSSLIWVIFECSLRSNTGILSGPRSAELQRCVSLGYPYSILGLQLGYDRVHSVMVRNIYLLPHQPPNLPQLTSQTSLDPLLTSDFQFTNLVDGGVGLGINCSRPTAALASSLTSQDRDTLGFDRPEYILASRHRLLQRWHLITSVVYKQVGIITQAQCDNVNYHDSCFCAYTNDTP